MISYNIRAIHSGTNEYRGTIIVDKDRTIYGKGTEENYDNKTIFMGRLSKSKKTLIFKLISSTGKITELKMSQNEYFPQKSIAPSICFYGDGVDDTGWFVEITKLRDIEKNLAEEKRRIVHL